MDEIKKLKKALYIAKIRLSICLGRMAACEEERPDTHPVSLDEIPAWIEEMEELLK